MKKLGLLVGALALTSLTGCFNMGGGGNPEAEKRAIDLAKQQTIASVSKETALVENTPADIGWSTAGVYNNDFLFLTTSQLVLDKESGDEFTVAIEWSYDSSYTFVREKVKVDDTHENIYFNYSKTEEYDFNFSAKLTCGSAEAVTANYQVHLKTKNIEFEELSIQEIYEANSGNNGFALVDPTTGYYAKNNDNFDYLCVETYGQVIYFAPDGDWALIGDGNWCLELFAGGSSAKPLTSDSFPAFTVGSKVKVQGELTSYYGNAQMAYIFDITATDKPVTAPANFPALSGSQFSGKHYWEGGLMNSIRTISAVYAGNLKDKSGNAVTAADLSNGRFTFDATVDGVTIQVAYDYHVDRNGDLGVFNAYKAKLQSLSNGAAFTLKGTVRFTGPTQKSYNGNETATTWSIVPWAADHFQ